MGRKKRRFGEGLELGKHQKDILAYLEKEGSFITINSRCKQTLALLERRKLITIVKGGEIGQLKYIQYKESLKLWQVKIYCNQKIKHIGNFKTRAEAVEARNESDLLIPHTRKQRNKSCWTAYLIKGLI